jgi:hypothetical protein
MSFITESCLVKTNREDDGNNGILFKAYLDYWRKERNRLMSKQVANKAAQSQYDLSTKNWFNANPPEKAPRYSVDNMTGLYAIKMLHGESLKGLPIFKWNDRIWWHPNGWMIFLAAKFCPLKYVFLPFLLAMAIYSCARPKEVTTGKNLWWLRFKMLKLSIFLTPLEKLIRGVTIEGVDEENKYGVSRIYIVHKGFAHTFLYYFKFLQGNRDHPINTLVKNWSRTEMKIYDNITTGES